MEREPRSPEPAAERRPRPAARPRPVAPAPPGSSPARCRPGGAPSPGPGAGRRPPLTSRPAAPEVLPPRSGESESDGVSAAPRAAGFRGPERRPPRRPHLPPRPAPPEPARGAAVPEHEPGLRDEATATRRPDREAKAPRGQGRGQGGGQGRGQGPPGRDRPGRRRCPGGWGRGRGGAGAGGGGGDSGGGSGGVAPGRTRGRETLFRLPRREARTEAPPSARVTRQGPQPAEPGRPEIFLFSPLTLLGSVSLRGQRFCFVCLLFSAIFWSLFLHSCCGGGGEKGSGDSRRTYRRHRNCSSWSPILLGLIVLLCVCRIPVLVTRASNTRGGTRSR